jgi:hypothetical protein
MQWHNYEIFEYFHFALRLPVCLLFSSHLSIYAYQETDSEFAELSTNRRIVI